MTSQSSNSKDLSKERYSQFAQGYVNSLNHAKGYDLDRLVELANPQLTWDVLDVATGGGHTALKFAPFVRQVIASDLTPNMLEAARQHLLEKGVQNVKFELADAEDLPFEDARFDLVTCRIAPHHFPNAAQFVLDSTRVLKQGGILLVQDQVLPQDKASATYVDDFERLRDPSHHRAFNEVEWRAMFEQAGLVVVHTEQIVKRHHLVTWAKRQGNDAETITQLQDMLAMANPSAGEWLDATGIGTPEASFVNHHLLIMGRKH